MKTTIGICDSGVGGLNVWRELDRLLPSHDIVYFADSAHLPYGCRPADEVRTFAEGIVRFLIDNSAQVIVMACNTMSIAALKSLREQIPSVPFVGMEPAIKVAASLTKNNTIGVMATQGTLKGEMYHDLIKRYASEKKVVACACPGLVEAVERGELESPATDQLLHGYLQPFVDGQVDQVVLGCTHYPFLRPAIERLAAGRFSVIDPAPAVARQTLQVMKQLTGADDGAPDENNAPGARTFYTSGDAKAFMKSAGRLLSMVNYDAMDVRNVRWEEGRIRRSQESPFD